MASFNLKNNRGGLLPGYFLERVLIPPLQQKPPTTVQHAHLIDLPAFFVKEIEAINEASEVVPFAIDIGDIEVERVAQASC